MLLAIVPDKRKGAGETDDRSPQVRARVTSVGALLLATLFVLAAIAAVAAPAQAADDTIHIVGQLNDTRVKPAKPVPGVKITVEDEAGKLVGTAVSNKQGSFSIPLGPGDQVLGKTYTIRIDTSTLPPGAALRNPKQVVLKQTITITSDVVVTFPIGNASTETSTLVQGIQLVIGGIVFSLILAMASLGLSMIFGTTGLTNFAHGELVTFGALMAYAVDLLPGTITLGGHVLTIYVGILVAIVLSGAFGWLQDRVLWRPLRTRGTGIIAAMIVSIGLSIFLRNVFQFFAGADNHGYSQYATPEPWHIGAVLVTPKAVGVAIFAAIVLVLVTLALQRTRVGKATRAVADNPALAASSGINVNRVISVVWTGGAALAGLSGVLLGMTQGFDYQVGFKILLLVFAAVVLGGLGTIWGAIAGSFIIGIFIEVSTLVIPSELKFTGALAVLIVVLLIRPQGLLGRPQRVG
jgi:branched-subunit amino acid ABC-type transport system permease component